MTRARGREENEERRVDEEKENDDDDGDDDGEMAKIDVNICLRLCVLVVAAAEFCASLC